MPTIRWGVLSPEGDEIHPVGSYAQAWALAATWDTDHPDPAVIVAQRAGWDWVTSDGVTYRDPSLVGTDECDDMMADLANAALWLLAVQALADTDPSAAAHLAALEHEAVAHGHDLG